MTARVEFFYDCSSPWTYLAFVNIQPIIASTGAEIDWRPILVGGIFNKVNEQVYEQRANPHPVKAKYTEKDLQDWARHTGVKIVMPDVFPVRAVKCMRGALHAKDEGRIVPYSTALFEAYWGRNRDISQDEELARICDDVALDRDAFFAAIETPEIKQRLIDNTEEVIARGGFGSPTIFVNGDDMYFGNDRLPLVRDAILRAA